MRPPAFQTMVPYNRTNDEHDMNNDIVREFAIATLGLCTFDKTIQYPLINQVVVDKQIIEDPIINVYRAHYKFKKDPEHRIFNVQLKETRLLVLVNACRNREQLKEVLQGKVMELYSLHYLEHKNIMKALWTDLSNPDLGLYVSVTKPYVSVRKLMEKSHATYFDDVKRYFFAVHPDQVIGKDIIAYVCHEVLNALCYLHEHNIYHNNVIADSVYIDKEGNVVLGDFDKAEYVPRDAQIGIEHYKDIQGLGILHAHMYHPQAILNYEKKANASVTPVDHKDIYASLIEAMQPYVSSEKFRDNTEDEREFWACILMHMGFVGASRLILYDLFLPPANGYKKIKTSLRGHMKEVNAWPKPHVEEIGLIERTRNRKPPSKVEPELRTREVQYGPPPQLEITTIFTFKAHDGNVVFRDKLTFKSTEEHKLLAFLKHFEDIDDPTNPPERYGFEGRQKILLPWEVLNVRKFFDACMDDLLLGQEVSSAVVKLKMGTLEMGLVIPDIRR